MIQFKSLSCMVYGTEVEKFCIMTLPDKLYPFHTCIIILGTHTQTMELASKCTFYHFDEILVLQIPLHSSFTAVAWIDILLFIGKWKWGGEFYKRLKTQKQKKSKSSSIAIKKRDYCSIAIEAILESDKTNVAYLLLCMWRPSLVAFPTILQCLSNLVLVSMTLMNTGSMLKYL